MLTTVLLAALIGQSTPAKPEVAPVLLAHKYFKGEVAAYKMNALLTVEIRETGLQTFLPMTTGYEYAYNYTVNSVDEDGNASMRYIRPATYRIDGENGEMPETRVKEEGELKFDIVATPINELLSAKIVKPPAKPGAKPTRTLNMMQEGPGGTTITDILMGNVIGELYRMALNVGSLDSSFEFSPKLPEEEVKPGDTWAYTLSYAPQKLAGSNKQANQRLDVTYVYEGVKTGAGNKPVHRITASLKLDNDMVSYVNGNFGLSDKDSPFKALKVKYDLKYRYDLDLKTCSTIYAESNSTGTIVTEFKGETEPIAERKITGTSTLTRLKYTVPSAQPSKPAPKPRAKPNQ